MRVVFATSYQCSSQWHHDNLSTS